MPTPLPDTPGVSREDANGHRIDSHGKLVFDERCHGCDAPLPEEEMKKLREDVSAILPRLHDHYPAGECTVRRYIQRLEARLSHVEKVAGEYKAVLEQIRDRHSNDAENCGDEATYHEANKALISFPL